MKGIDTMPSPWKTTDRMPRNNTMKKELDRLERIINALEFALLENRKKHYMRDLEELRRSHEELIRLFEDGDDE